MSRFVVFFLLNFINSVVLAQSYYTCLSSVNRTGVFQNVSSSGVASINSPVTACTVINSKESLDSVTAFCAETSEDDAVLEIFYTQEPKYPQVSTIGYVANPFPRKVVDNWLTTITSSEQRLLEGHLRLPMRYTDAAVLLRSDPVYYSAAFRFSPYYVNTAGTSVDDFIAIYNFGVCARGYPKNGSAFTNVSITNLGPSKANSCYAVSGSFFER